MWVLTAAMVAWASGYLAIILAQGDTQDWWAPGWFVAMALIPAGAMVVGLTGASPRRLVVATATLASWAAILGVLGLVTLVGAPLLLVEPSPTSSSRVWRTDGRAGRTGAGPSAWSWSAPRSVSSLRSRR